MRPFIARHGKCLFTLLAVIAAFAVFFAGRAVLHQMIATKVHSDMCRSKPDAEVKHPAKIWSRNE